MIDDDLARLRQHVEHVAETGMSRLPPEPKLGEELGLSRGRLRTLLKKLEDEGKIWRHVGKGTFVGARAETQNDQHWADTVSVDDIFDARLAIEPQLAAQAAVRATAADVNGMERCLFDMKVAPSFLVWRQYDEKLHRLVAEATHNNLFVKMYETLRAQVRLNLDSRMEEIFSDASGPKSTTDDEHVALVAAIRHHNPERAGQAMTSHIMSVRQLVFGMR